MKPVDIVLADENAKEYLAIVDQDETTNVTEYFTQVDDTTDAFSSFAVVKKSATTALAKDVACTVQVKVEDMWGKITTTNVVITLKK